jgi:hypothetical protein
LRGRPDFVLQKDRSCSLVGDHLSESGEIEMTFPADELLSYLAGGYYIDRKNFTILCCETGIEA